MEEPRSFDDVQRSLQNSLDRIEGEVGRILEGTTSAENAEQILESLDARAEDLCRAIERLNASLDEFETNSTCDLNALAESALAEQLDQVAHPVVVNSAWYTGLPHLEIPADSVTSALEQAIRLSLEFAGRGGEARFETSAVGDDVRFSADVSRHETDSIDLDTFVARFASVTDFVELLGGGFQIDVVDGASLGLELRLPAGVEA